MIAFRIGMVASRKYMNKTLHSLLSHVAMATVVFPQNML